MRENKHSYCRSFEYNPKGNSAVPFQSLWREKGDYAEYRKVWQWLTVKQFEKRKCNDEWRTARVIFAAHFLINSEQAYPISRSEEKKKREREKLLGSSETCCMREIRRRAVEEISDRMRART